MKTTYNLNIINPEPNDFGMIFYIPLKINVVTKNRAYNKNKDLRFRINDNPTLDKATIIVKATTNRGSTTFSFKA